MRSESEIPEDHVLRSTFDREAVLPLRDDRAVLDEDVAAVPVHVDAVFLAATDHRITDRDI